MDECSHVLIMVKGAVEGERETVRYDYVADIKVFGLVDWCEDVIILACGGG